MTGLNRRLILETWVQTADGAGGFEGGWTALGIHWGAVEPRSGRLERGEEFARSRVQYRVRIRAVPVLSAARPQPGQRFREGTRHYDIRSVQDSADARFLVCIVEEETAA